MTHLQFPNLLTPESGDEPETPIKTCTCGTKMTTKNSALVGEQDISALPHLSGKTMLLYNCPNCGTTTAHLTDSKSLKKSAATKLQPIVTPVQGFEEHFPEILDGLNPDDVHEHLDHEETGAVSHGTYVANHSKMPFKVLVKPAQSEELNIDFREFFKKPQDRHFFDDNFTTSHREVLYPVLAHKVFGLGKYVPPTTAFYHNGIAHSGQLFVNNATPLADTVSKYSDIGEFQAVAPLAERAKLAIMNEVLGNHDRHFGNVLLDSAKRMHLIDHGFAFDYGNVGKYRKPPSYVHSQELNVAIPNETYKWLQSLDENALHHHMIKIGTPRALADVARGRLKAMKELSQHLPPQNVGLNSLIQVSSQHHLDDNLQHTNPPSVFKPKE